MRRYCVLSILFLFVAPIARADFPTSQPYPGVTYRLLELKNPPNRIHVVTVNMGTPGLKITVARASGHSEGPDGYETRLLGPLAIADRDHLDIVVNGDFFEAQRFKNEKGTTRPFAPGDPANVHGPAESDGVTWAVGPTTRPALIITRDGKARIQRRRSVPADALEVIGGSSIMLKGGKVQPMPTSLETTPNPRTAVGFTAEGATMVIVVDDGRWKEHSVGLSTTDLAKVMHDLGCTEAINLDGGGSTEMALRDPATGQLVVLNHPSEGKERPVANALGVRVQHETGVPPPVTQPVTRPSP